MFKKITSKLALALAFAGSMAVPVVAHASEIVKASGDFIYVKLTNYMAHTGMLLGISTLPNAFVQQFDTTFREQAQQKESRLESTVTDRGTITGESFTANMIGALQDTPEKKGRHADTEWDEADHSTRVGLMRDFFHALPVDRNDIPKLLANPNGPYMEALKSAWNRRKDRIIFDALIGSAQLKDGSSVVLPNTQIILHGGTGMTKAKIIQARKIFRGNESDQHNGEDLYFIYTADMMEDVLSDTTLTSADFLAAKMLQEGDVSGKWMGFKWVPYEAIKRSGNVQSTAAYTKSALHKGLGYLEATAGPRKDKQNTLQLDAAGSFGAVRVEEAKVVEVQYQ